VNAPYIEIPATVVSAIGALFQTWIEVALRFSHVPSMLVEQCAAWFKERLRRG